MHFYFHSTNRTKPNIIFLLIGQNIWKRFYISFLYVRWYQSPCITHSSRLPLISFLGPGPTSDFSCGCWAILRALWLGLIISYLVFIRICCLEKHQNLLLLSNWNSESVSLCPLPALIITILFYFYVFNFSKVYMQSNNTASASMSLAYFTQHNVFCYPFGLNGNIFCF